MAYRSPRKNYAKAYNSSPYTTWHPADYRPGKFDPALEDVDLPGLHASPDPDRARSNPLHYYVLRSGKHQSKTLVAVHSIDIGCIGWIKREHYTALPPDHLIRKAIDQWEQAGGGLPVLSSAPDRFKESNGRGGQRFILMQERFLKKTWKVTAQELEEAGAKSYVNENTKSKAKKFNLFHVYEYAKGKGGMSTAGAEEALRTELERIAKTRKNYNRHVDGYSSGGYHDDDDGFHDFCLL